MNELSRIFIEEHASMNAMFKEYSKTKDTERKRTVLKDIKRQLFEHFKEEELYYSKYDKNIGSTFLTLKRLISEHELMRDMIMQENPNLKTFTEFLIAHEHIEENTIYPELEKHVSREDISALMKRLLRQ